MISDPNNWTESGLSFSENSKNSVISFICDCNCFCFATIAFTLVSSVTTRPAPIFLHIKRNAGSLTPAIGAKNALLEKYGNSDM